MVGRWLFVLTMVAACGGKSGGGGDAGGDGGGSVDTPGGGDDGPPGGTASCAGLPSTCGPTDNDSCCASAEVTGGSYHRSFDVAGDGASGSLNFPATVSTFRLDKYEVTVGRFRVFVAAGKGTQASAPAVGDGAHAKIAASGWAAAFNANLLADGAALVAALKCDASFQTWTDSPGANENRPMNCVSWFEAMAFCIFDGGYLATEAEWNYAATGGDQQRAFPWSSPASSVTIDGTHASYLVGTDCVGDGAAGCALTDLVAVGTKPAGQGRFAQSDLAGNVEEWALDFVNLYPMPCDDCASLTASTTRSVRGGDYQLQATGARTGTRGGLPPKNRRPDVGIRCARP
jgi:formylglycine-generating enzyme required for sulfatase activity